MVAHNEHSSVSIFIHLVFLATIPIFIHLELLNFFPILKAYRNLFKQSAIDGYLDSYYSFAITNNVAPYVWLYISDKFLKVELLGEQVIIMPS